MNHFQSKTTPRFWECLRGLPMDVQEQAAKQYALFEANPFHPSLRFKATGPYWSVRVSRGCRALALRQDNVLTWLWIGPDDQYDRILKG